MPGEPALAARERGRPALVPALHDAGVDIREHPEMAHAKVVLADDTVLAGTANLDALSLRQNWELQLRIEDPAVADHVARELFDRDMVIARAGGDAGGLEGPRDQRADVGDLAAALGRVEPAVDDQVDAVHRGVLEEEPGRIDDLGHGHEAAHRGLGRRALDRRRLPAQ